MPEGCLFFVMGDNRTGSHDSPVPRGKPYIPVGTGAGPVMLLAISLGSGAAAGRACGASAERGRKRFGRTKTDSVLTGTACWWCLVAVCVVAYLAATMRPRRGHPLQPSCGNRCSRRRRCRPSPSSDTRLHRQACRDGTTATSDLYELRACSIEDLNELVRGAE